MFIKISRKARKSLKFLKKTERKELINSLNEKRDLFNRNLSSLLSKDYENYLKHFPIRSLVFECGVKSQFFSEIASSLFGNLIDQYNQIHKGSAKYSRYQLNWYLFSGNFLDKSTNSELDVLVQNYETEISENVPGSTQKDIRIYLSCLLRSCFSCFQQRIIEIKSKKKQNKKQNIKHYSTCDSFDDTSLYRITGAVIRKMLRKRYSYKFFNRHSKTNQDAIKEETKLVKLLCLSKQAKQIYIEKLPAGFQVLDKGGLIVVKPRVLNFVRHFSRLYRINVNTNKYTLLGSQMLKLARIVVVHSKTTKSMFFDCSRHVSGSVSFSDSVVLSVYKELTEKLFNTLSNEFLKKLKFLSVNKAQVMLRDKLKVLATQKGKKQL